MFDKVVIVTWETRMDQLLRAFQTKDQARFYLAQAAQAAAPPSLHQKRGAGVRPGTTPSVRRHPSSTTSSTLTAHTARR